MPEVKFPTVLEESKPEVDEATKELQAAAELLSKAARDREARPAILKEVESHLSKLRITDFPDLADSPVVQAFVRAVGVGDLKPGESRNKGTLAHIEREWTINDMAQFPTKTFEPRETIPITFNGITYQLIDGHEVTVPEPIYNIYREHRAALDQAKIHENYLLGYSHQQPHPNWMSDTSAKVHAFSQLGPTPDPRKRGYGPIGGDEAEAAGEASNG